MPFPLSLETKLSSAGTLIDFPLRFDDAVHILYHIPLDELLPESLAQRSGALLDDNTCTLECGDLAVRTTLATGHNGTGVTHSPAWRGGDTSDEADHGLPAGVGLLQEVSGVLLSRTTDLADHDDSISLRVLKEDTQAVDEVGAGEGVTTDTDHKGLAEPGLGGLVDGFVGQGTGARDDTDAAALVNEAWHDTDLALARCNDTWAVGPDQSRLALCLQHVRDADHVVLRDTLSNAYYQTDLGGNGLLNTLSSKRRRDEDGRGIGASLLHSIADGSEDGLAQVLGAGFLGVGAADNVGAVVDGLLGVESTLTTSEALVDELGLVVDPQVAASSGIASGRGDGGVGGAGDGRRGSGCPQAAGQTLSQRSHCVKISAAAVSGD